MLGIINWQNTEMYDIIRNLLAIIFYILLFLYIFYKFSNLKYVKKLNYKQEYENKKKEISEKFEEKKGKVFKNISKLLVVIFAVSILISLLLLFVNIIIFIFTGLGIMLASKSPIIEAISEFMLNSVGFLISVPAIGLYLVTIIFYVVVYYFFIKGIYVNKKIKKYFNEKYIILNDKDE